jgi:microcystin-dependent protein
MSSFLLNYKKGLTGIPQTQANEATNYFAPNVAVPPTPPAVVPFTQGMIMMWDKTSAYPTGWYLCNGQIANGYTTPTLIDKFVMSVGVTNPTVGLGGGAVSTLLTLNMLPDHTHTGTLLGTDSGTKTAGFSFASGDSTGGINSAGYTAGTPVPTLPPYVTYAYICYCGVPA